MANVDCNKLTKTQKKHYNNIKLVRFLHSPSCCYTENKNTTKVNRWSVRCFSVQYVTVYRCIDARTNSNKMIQVKSAKQPLRHCALVFWALMTSCRESQHIFLACRNAAWHYMCVPLICTLNIPNSSSLSRVHDTLWYFYWCLTRHCSSHITWLFYADELTVKYVDRAVEYLSSLQSASTSYMQMFSSNTKIQNLGRLLDIVENENYVERIDDCKIHSSSVL